MTDGLAILLSCCMLAFVIIRAIRLDARLPWFEPIGERSVAGAEGAPKAAPPQGMLSAKSRDPQPPARSR